jgi:hypothetical protein
MKAFFISIAAIVIGGFVFLTQFASIGDKMIEKVRAQEGDRVAVFEALRQDEKAFIAKHQPLLERRWQVAHFALFLDEDYFMALSKESIALYEDTPMEAREPYDRFLFERAKRMDNLPSMELVGEAFKLYKLHIKHFPTSKQGPLAVNAVNRLVIKFGFQ